MADGKGNVFVNIEDKSEIVRIDAKKLTVPSTIRSRGARNPAHWRSTRRIVGCSPDATSKIMAVVDPDSGKVVTTVAIGGGVDAGAFNPKTQQIFMSCGRRSR